MKQLATGAAVLLLCACLCGAGCTSGGDRTADDTPAGTTEVGMANPSAVWCDEMGYDYEIRKDADGNEYGVCIFPNGTEMDAWEAYRAAMTAGAPAVTLNESADGTTVDLTEGESVTIELEENPTTGYQWNATVSNGLVIVSDTYTVDEHPAGMVGVGGTRTWVVRADGSGIQTFSAVYHRPWENVTATDTAFSVTFNVAGA
ncbi:protease inhibitor I42 family protein [Methanofollis fontis]|nr:protease inhibitor I42 family protein [Methanofollis fontis]